MDGVAKQTVAHSFRGRRSSSGTQVELKPSSLVSNVTVTSSVGPTTLAQRGQRAEGRGRSMHHTRWGNEAETKFGGTHHPTYKVISLVF